MAPRAPSRRGAIHVSATTRRWGARAAWAACCLALIAVGTRISFSARIDSDGANNALQAWDLAHGHLLLHGWHLGDATFATFELPVIGITELVLGFGATALHVASALVFTVVAGCAVALAVTDSHGQGQSQARAARAAVVIAVLAAPLLAAPGVPQGLEEPDHTGSAVFILLAALLIDRAPGWRDARWRYAAPPLLALLLCAGQLGDLTVRYTGVPAVVVVCGCRALAARRGSPGRWLPDAAFALAAVVSVPLESAVRAVLTQLGGFVMVAPRTELSAPRLWPHHAAVTWLDIRELFGAVAPPGGLLGPAGRWLAALCLAVAICGLARVAWAWRRASAAELALALAILLNAALYLASVMPMPNGQREVALILPCGAVLAARACVPARFAGTGRTAAASARTVTAAAVALAVIPLAAAVTRPPLPAAQAPLAAWLEAHHLSYGIAGYWDASVVTLESGGQVRVRAVDLHRQTAPPGINAHLPGWEANILWYDPARYDATFIVADKARRTLYPVADFEAFFGKPAHAYPVGQWVVLVYRKNLLARLLPMLP